MANPQRGTGEDDNGEQEQNDELSQHQAPVSGVNDARERPSR